MYVCRLFSITRFLSSAAPLPSGERRGEPAVEALWAHPVALRCLPLRSAVRPTSGKCFHSQHVCYKWSSCTPGCWFLLNLYIWVSVSLTHSGLISSILYPCFPPPPPMECIRGRMRIPIYLGKWGTFWVFVSRRFAETTWERGHKKKNNVCKFLR